jgi:5'-deoxynucleotidase YfbR-like HD superfamily hydrolase
VDRLALLLELQQLDRVPRSGYSLRGVVDPESVSEHGWHLCFLVWSLSRDIAELDRARALELALVHDLAEVRIGDLPRPAARYFPPASKEQAEAAAPAELLAPLGEEAFATFAEYQAGQTLEARFVKACDGLQMMLKVAAYERQGNGDLADFWQHAETLDDGGFAPVRSLLDALQAAQRTRR